MDLQTFHFTTAVWNVGLLQVSLNQYYGVGQVASTIDEDRPYILICKTIQYDNNFYFCTNFRPQYTKG